MQTSDKVLEGIALCLWASAWADALEGAGRSDVISGRNVYDVMPECPDVVYLEAAKIYGRVEQGTGHNIPALVHAAYKADWAFKTANPPEESDEYHVRFGECIAYAYMGTGVGWDDDHEDFDTNLCRDILGGESLLWSEFCYKRLNDETPCEVRDAAEECVRKAYPQATEHFVYGSGMVGCLYDNGPHQADTQAGAIAALLETFSDLPSKEKRAMRRNLSRDGIHYFSTDVLWDYDGVYGRTKADRTHSARMLAGADYCDVSKANGPRDDSED